MVFLMHISIVKVQYRCMSIYILLYDLLLPPRSRMSHELFIDIYDTIIISAASICVTL